MREGRANPTISKKRRQESNDSPTNGLARGARSHPDVLSAVRDQHQAQALRRASTFPKHRSNAPRVDTPGFDLGVPSTTQSVSGLSSAGPYTPTSANFGPQVYGPLDSSPGSMQQPYGVQNNLASIPDLSAMMFPSSEPFTYPNQPLTTFENNHLGKEPSFYNNMNGYNVSGAMMPPSMQATSDNDNLEAQLYALPPNMSQSDQWSMGMVGQQPQVQRSGMTSATDQSSIGAASLPSWNGYQQAMSQHQTFSDINLNEIFGGGEWNHMFPEQ